MVNVCSGLIPRAVISRWTPPIRGFLCVVRQARAAVVHVGGGPVRTLQVHGWRRHMEEITRNDGLPKG